MIAVLSTPSKRTTRIASEKDKQHHSDHHSVELENPLAKVLSGGLRIIWAITSENQWQTQNGEHYANNTQSQEIARNTSQPLHRHETRRLVRLIQGVGGR